MARVSAPAEIGLVLFPGVQQAAVHGLTDLLRIADRLAFAHAGTGGLRLRVTHWQPDAQATNVRCVYDSDPAFPPRPDFVVVTLTLVDQPAREVTTCIAAWLRDQHARGATVGSVCSGALLLAESGLLAGRTVSTHWSSADELAARFPDIRVVLDKRVIDHGDVVTAGGFMAWVDLGLTLVERLLGATIRAETAHYLMVDQETRERSYFTGFTPRLSHGDAAVLRAQHWAHGRDGCEITLTDMARRARLESRTFLRRFLVATGMTPIEYCRGLRIARARELLEFSNQTLKEIAWAVGYADVAAFARTFRRVVGMPPAAYRRQVAPIQLSQRGSVTVADDLASNKPSRSGDLIVANPTLAAFPPADPQPHWWEQGTVSAAAIARRRSGPRAKRV